MASLREWIALTLSALLFSVVAGYGVGRALNAKYEAPAPRPALSAVPIVDRTGEPAASIGSLSAEEREMPSVVASIPDEPPSTTVPEAPAPTALPSALPSAAPPAAAASVPPAPRAVVPPPPAAPSPALSVAANERTSALISFADQRLYLMAGDRVLASYRVKFGFDPSRVKPSETTVLGKSGARRLDLGWKSFPVASGGERGFILSAADFEAVSARLPVGAQIATTRERVRTPSPPPAPAAGRANARVPPSGGAKQPQPTPAKESPSIDAQQPAFLAAAPRPR